MAELVDSAPASALAIYAHPDDPDVSCGGTLARWAAAGADIWVCICADRRQGVPRSVGRSGRAGRPGAAARWPPPGAVLGVAGHHLLGYPDGELHDDEELRGRLVGLIRSVRPEAVVCPDPTAVFFGEHYANHRDHRVVGWAALDAVTPAAGMPRLLPRGRAAAHRPAALYLSGTLEPDVWVDITGTIDQKAQALACHASQVGPPGEWLRSVVRQRAEAGGRQAGVRYAEGFRRLLLA